MAGKTNNSNRILIALPNDNLGGAEQYLKMVAEFFFQEGYRIDVYFLKKKVSGAWDELAAENFNLYFTTYTREKFGVWGMFKKLLMNRKRHYSYVFTSHIHVNSFISLLRKAAIVKADYHIARESTSTFERYKGLKLFIFKTHYRVNYNKIDLLVCQTDFMNNQLKKAMPQLFDSIKVKTIPNPIDLNKLMRIESGEEVPFSNFIVSAGRLIVEKGFDILIESFHQLQNDFPEIKLVILGEGQLRVELSNRIRELGLENHVFLPGFVKNVYPYFSNAEMCVVSSRIEGFPNVLLQMMSQNNKVVSTTCAGGIEELKGVFTCPTESSTLLFEAMKLCLHSNTDRQKQYFREEIQSRSIESFVQKVVHYLD